MNNQETSNKWWILAKLINRPLCKLDFMIFKISLLYVLFGFAWVYITDSTLLRFTDNQQHYSTLSTYKGYLFVLVSGIFLLFLLNKMLKHQKTIELNLKNSEERWKFALESAYESVWDWSIQSDHFYKSERWYDIYGYAENEIYQTCAAYRDLIHPDDIQGMIKAINECLNGSTDRYISEYRVQCKDGSWKWTLSRGMVVARKDDGTPMRMIGTHCDVSDRKKTEAEVLRLANYDPLTETPNRTLFKERFNEDIRKANWAGNIVTIICLDIDDFKHINDTYGHHTGDILLKQTARRLESCVRNTDVVSRPNGDEFTIILNELENNEVIQRIVNNILTTMRTTYHVGNHILNITISMGISRFPTDGKDIDTLLNNADKALYMAKQRGRDNFVYYTEEKELETI